MESVLGRGSNGQAIDLVVVTNATALENADTEFNAIGQGYDFTSDGGNIDGLIDIATTSSVSAAAVSGTEVVESDTIAGVTTIAYGDLTFTDDDFIGQTLRVFRAAGATLANATPLSGDASPHGPKGYVDLEITDSDYDSAGDQTVSTITHTAAGFATGQADHCAVLSGVLFTATGDVAKGAAKSIAIVTRER